MSRFIIDEIDKIKYKWKLLYIENSSISDMKFWFSKVA